MELSLVPRRRVERVGQGLDSRDDHDKAQRTKRQRYRVNKAFVILQPVHDSVVERPDATSAYQIDQNGDLVGSGKLACFVVPSCVQNATADKESNNRHGRTGDEWNDLAGPCRNGSQHGWVDGTIVGRSSPSRLEFGSLVEQAWIVDALCSWSTE